MPKRNKKELLLWGPVKILKQHICLQNKPIFLSSKPLHFKTKFLGFFSTLLAVLSLLSLSGGALSLSIHMRRLSLGQNSISMDTTKLSVSRLLSLSIHINLPRHSCRFLPVSCHNLLLFGGLHLRWS
ncbi:hypothetical protein ACP275_07G090100 [Erythranthe tilingii]